MSLSTATQKANSIVNFVSGHIRITPEVFVAWNCLTKFWGWGPTREGFKCWTLWSTKRGGGKWGIIRDMAFIIGKPIENFPALKFPEAWNYKAYVKQCVPNSQKRMKSLYCKDQPVEAPQWHNRCLLRGSQGVHKFNVYGSVRRNNILIKIQQDATLHSLFYLETALHVSGGTTTHHQERKQLYLQHLVFITPLLLPA